MPTQTDTKDAWQEFRPAEAGFVMLLPSKPKEAKAQMQIGAQTFKTHSYMLHDSANDYAVSYFELPQPSEPRPLKTLFDEVRDATVATFKGQLLAEQPGQFQGYPARALKIATGPGETIQSLLCLVEQRVYTVTVKTQIATDNSQPGKVAADRFIRSIKFTPVDSFGAREVDQFLNQEQVLSPGEGKAQGVVYGKILTPLRIPYPFIAKASHASGTIVVSAVIDEAGKVVAVQGYSGHPMLVPVVIEAVRAARFAPATLDGKPIKVWVFVHYNFVLQ